MNRSTKNAPIVESGEPSVAESEVSHAEWTAQVGQALCDNLNRNVAAEQRVDQQRQK